jgi:hypothetical protein
MTEGLLQVTMTEGLGCKQHCPKAWLQVILSEEATLINTNRGKHPKPCPLRLTQLPFFFKK